MKSQPRILFLSLTNNDGVNGPVMGFGRLGCECAVISPPGFTCASSRFATRHFPLPKHRGIWLGLLYVRPALERAIRDWHPDLIQPLDDVSAWMLRGLATSASVSADLRRALEASLGAPSGYDAACCRAQFLDLATRIGVRAPRSRAAGMATAQEAAAAVGYPVALKLEHSCAGFGVTIVQDAAQLQAAITTAGFGRWRSLTHFAALLKRGKESARRIAWRLAGLRTIAKTPFELQQFIGGAGAMRIVVAWQGRVLAGMSLDRICVNRPPYGNATVMRVIDHPEMEASTQKIVAALGYSGIAHFDFIVEEGTRHAYVIEMNPRATASVHLGRHFGMDLCGAMVRQLGGSVEPPAADSVLAPKPIVRFPRELERDPDSVWLRAGSDVFHDVPWDDPTVFEIYYRRLLRRHPGHAAKFARLLGRPAPVVAETSSPDRFWDRLRFVTRL